MKGNILNISKERSKEISHYVRVYCIGVLMTLFLCIGCEDDIYYGLPWLKGNSLYQKIEYKGGKDALVVNNVQTHLFMIPPDTINLVKKEDFESIVYTLTYIFSAIKLVDKQHIETPVGIDYINWFVSKDGSDSVPGIAPISRVYNVKENRNTINIPGSTIEVKIPSVKGTIHGEYESFSIHLIADSLWYRVNIRIGFTSYDQKVKLPHVMDIIATVSEK